MNYESQFGVNQLRTVEIFDVMGRRQRVESAEVENSLIIDISYLPTGVYYLRVGMETVKVVKQ
jgi:hypothetical protein